MLCKEVTRGSKKISPEITDVIKNVITPAAEENKLWGKPYRTQKKHEKKKRTQKE